MLHKYLRKVSAMLAMCVPLLLAGNAASVDAAVFFGCGDCSNCLGGHRIIRGNDVGGIHDWCVPLASCEGHPGCGVTLQGTGYTDLVARALDGDVAAVPELLVKFPTYSYINVDRRALQALGCNGGIMAHIPLTNTQLALVAESQGSDTLTDH